MHRIASAHLATRTVFKTFAKFQVAALSVGEKEKRQDELTVSRVYRKRDKLIPDGFQVRYSIHSKELEIK